MKSRDTAAQAQPLEHWPLRPDLTGLCLASWHDGWGRHRCRFPAGHAGECWCEDDACEFAANPRPAAPPLRVPLRMTGPRPAPAYAARHALDAEADGGHITAVEHQRQIEHGRRSA